MDNCSVCSFGVVFVLSFVDLFAWAPMVFTLLLKKFDFMHPTVTSDIPGNPHAFDDSIISAMRTLPEPSNFNLVWTGLPLDEPLVIRGTVPPSRCNSVSVYGDRKDAPCTIDLATVGVAPGCSFEVPISPGEPVSPTTESPTRELKVRGWKRGYVVMRNYVVPPGTRVITPEIVRQRDQKVLRQSKPLVSGACEVAQSDTFKSRCIRVLLANLVFIAVAMCFVLARQMKVISIDLFVPIRRAILLSMILGACWYQLLFFAGKRSLQKMVATLCPQENVFQLTSLEQGNEVSQPSALHKYYFMRYDIPHGSELHIRTKINPAYHKYWSFVFYDMYGLPSPQYVYDDNYPNRMSVPDGENKSEYEVHVCLTHTPGRHVSHGNCVDIDVSGSSKGYVIFRLVHPQVAQCYAASLGSDGSLRSPILPGDEEWMNTSKHWETFSHPATTLQLCSSSSVPEAGNTKKNL